MPVELPPAPTPPAAPPKRRPLGRRPGASRLDPHRVARLIELIDAGVPREDAYWQVMSDPLLGRNRYIALRQSGGRMDDARLRQGCSGLLIRTAPSAVTEALARAKHVLSGAAEKIARELVKNATTTVKDTATEKFSAGVSAQTKAAELAFRVLGAIGQGNPTQVNTQVNVAFENEASRQRAAEVLAGKVHRATRIEDRAAPCADEPAPSRAGGAR